MRLNIRVCVPRIAFAVVHLHHADAALHEAHCRQTPARGAAGPVQLEGGLALLPDVEHVRRLGLHPIRHFHRLNRRFELRVGRRVALHLEPVQRLEEIELTPLLGQRELLVADVGNQLLRIEILSHQVLLVLLLDLVRDVGALMCRGQERAVPQRRSDGGRHLRAEDDVAGQVLVVGAEAVREPGA